MGLNPWNPFDLGTATFRNPLTLELPDTLVMWKVGLCKAGDDLYGEILCCTIILPPLDWTDAGLFLISHPQLPLICALRW